MSTATSNVTRMKRPMKTFDADDSIFDLLEKASALLTKAQGKNYPEGRIVKETLLEHAANRALRDAPALLKAQIEGLSEKERATGAEEALRRQVEMRRAELLSVCEMYGIAVDPKLLKAQEPRKRRDGNSDATQE